MKIFFTGAFLSGKPQLPNYKLIYSLLEKKGEVLSSMVNDDVSEFGETEFSNHEILQRESSFVGASDIVVAELTFPSHGVGYLISLAEQQNKKIIGFYEGKSTGKLSSLIKGNPKIEIYTYQNKEDLEKIISTLFPAKQSGLSSTH